MHDTGKASLILGMRCDIISRIRSGKRKPTPYLLRTIDRIYGLTENEKKLIVEEAYPLDIDQELGQSS